MTSKTIVLVIPGMYSCKCGIHANQLIGSLPLSCLCLLEFLPDTFSSTDQSAAAISLSTRRIKVYTANDLQTYATCMLCVRTHLCSVRVTSQPKRPV